MFAIYQELDCQSTHIFLSSDVCFLYSKWIQLLEDKKLFAMFIQNDFQQKLSWLNMFNIWCALTNILYQQNQFPILTIIMTIMFNSLHLSLLLNTQYNWYVHPEQFCRCWHQVFGSKKGIPKRLGKGMLGSRLVKNSLYQSKVLT